MKRAWIRRTLLSGINVTPLPAIKFYWDDEDQNILANSLSPSPRLSVFVQKLKNAPNQSTGVSRRTPK